MFTKAQPGRDNTSHIPFIPAETNLIFLVKCAICILLVLVALQWRTDRAPTAHKEVAVRRAAPQQKAGGFVEDATQSAASLIRAGGDALAGAARDKCLATPRDCLSAAQRLQSAASRTR